MENLDNIKEILELIMKGISKEFGSKCEVVLHDHSKGLDKSIVAIENGHVTNRKVGGPSTNVGFEFSKQDQYPDIQAGYITKTKNGKVLRSSSVYFKNPQGKVIGALCINFDITNIVDINNEFNFLTNSESNVNELFSTNVNDIIYDLTEEYKLQNKFEDLSILNKKEMCDFLSYMEKRGVFSIRNAGQKLCKILKISKYTLYSYLKEINIQNIEEK